jgi:hypothetical protein
VLFNNFLPQTLSKGAIISEQMIDFAAGVENRLRNVTPQAQSRVRSFCGINCWSLKAG